MKKICLVGVVSRFVGKQVKTIFTGIILFCLVLPAVGRASSLNTVKVSSNEEAQWLRWIIPLPKKISIPSRVEIPVSEVKISLRPGAGAVEQTAFDQLVSLFKDKDKSGGTKGSFEILIGISDENGKIGGMKIPGVLGLKELPNSEQAYVICPIGKNKLVLSAIEEQGVYYAVQTLRQLLESKFANTNVSIPLARVTDWPDLAERGLWAGNPAKKSDMEWLSAYKINIFNYPVKPYLNGDGQWMMSKTDPNLIEFGRCHALSMTPCISHLGWIGAHTSLYKQYPELQGKFQTKVEGIDRFPGEPDKNLTPCASQPKLAEVIAEWMCFMAEQGVNDIDGWLSEGVGLRCECDKCIDYSQWALETRSYVNGWRIARRKYPKLKLRVWLTQGSYNTNDKVLAELSAKDAGVIYYEGGRTYNSTRDPMIYPLLEDFAAQGGWLGVVPQITASYGAVSPWNSPQFIKYRMNEFVNKKLKRVVTYSPPSYRIFDFNMTATAEWLWNTEGRDERAFTVAWATRRGFKDPVGVAEWAWLLGPVSWDVYGSEIPAQYFRKDHPDSAGAMIAARRKPVLGEVMFRYFPTLEHIDNDLAICEKALAIARRLDEPVFIEETRAIQGYVKMVKEIYHLLQQTSSLTDPTYEDRVKLQNNLERLTMASAQTTDALYKWGQATESGVSVVPRFIDGTMGKVEKIVEEIAASLAQIFGIRKIDISSRTREIGQWSKTDFVQGTRLIKKWDVTQYMITPGEYGIIFKAGHEVKISRVALAFTAKDKPDQLIELSVDEHNRVVSSGGWLGNNKGRDPVVRLSKHNPDVRYFLMADMEIIGKGTVFIKMLLPEKDLDGHALMQPMTDKELALARQSDAPVFLTQGLRVGVLASGYFKDVILDHLRKVPDLAVQPLTKITPEALAVCQVVILTQPKKGLGELSTRVLEKYVRAGGGLISFHDSVGYRYQAKLLTDICAGGAAHVRARGWIVVKEHPVTQGLQLNRKLVHTYYDRIELKPGPAGIILATAPQNGRPIVIAGSSGQGRYVAFGFAPGYYAQEKIGPLSKAESILLENAVQWCAQKGSGGLCPASAKGSLLPLTDEELKLSYLKKFTGQSLRVGVMQRGYGGPLIIEHLKTVAGIDAQPLVSPNEGMINACQVLVLPLLPRDSEKHRIPDQMVTDILKFVRGGGGLVMTGALPDIGLRQYGEVCTFERHSQSYDSIPWVVTQQHPITDGLELNKTFIGSPFSVEYTLGPEGLALAEAVGTHSPVLVAGPVGEGKVVIYGLLIGGKGRSGEKVITDEQKKIVENAVKWSGSGL